MTASRIRQLHETGVSIWLDDLSRALLEEGTLAEDISRHALSGVTSNPTIFAAALRDGERYDAQLRDLLAAGVRDAPTLFFALALRDVGDAARLLRDTYIRSGARDGYVSFECTPDVAHDAESTVRQATEVWDWVDEPNLMIKVPGTDAGIVAIEELTAAGVNVNVTLLFTASRYEQAGRAYQRGLARRAGAGEPIDGVRSVASVFVSRIDAKVEDLVSDRSLGSAAIANAHAIYERAVAVFDGPGWDALRERGATWQRPLWASTAPKSSRVPDVGYVEALALPDTIVTLPRTTFDAFADHGTARLARADEVSAQRAIARLARHGVDLEAVGRELEAAGIDAFSASYGEVLEQLDQRLHGTPDGAEAA
ncbi:MAG TPA: transaldolase [Solirubrobacteraceae bacterium]|nr:transaldolase [Solirubrobacteraceae bacterium]